MRSRNHLHVVLCGAVACLLTATDPVSAQNWEVEVHGGANVPGNPGAGSGSLPGAGSASAVTVSSWYFGDGAIALNQALAFFGSNAHVSPLDAVLQSPLFQRSAGTLVGARVSRRLTSRFSAEFSFDDSLGQLQVAPASQVAIGAASQSFISAWNGLLAAPSRGTQTVMSTASVVNARSNQRITTGAVVVNLTKDALVTPYALAGAGVVVNVGGEPSAQVSGSYQFTIVPSPVNFGFVGARYHETDTVIVGRSATNTPVGVFGLGAKIAVRSRWGLRIEVRDYLSKNTAVTTVTTTPAVQVSSPTEMFVLGTSPPLQFSTVPGTSSTLSQPLSNVATFRGGGVQNQVSLTLGWYWRF